MEGHVKMASVESAYAPPTVERVTADVSKIKYHNVLRLENAKNGHHPNRAVRVRCAQQVAAKVQARCVEIAAEKEPHHVWMIAVFRPAVGKPVVA